MFAVAYQNAENVLENDASPADVAAAYQALKSAKEGLTADNTKLKDLYDERTPLYEKYADIVVDEKNLNIEETLQKIIEKLKK